MKLTTAVLLSVFSTLPLAAEESRPIVAERITQANAATRLVAGSDAIGGIGDWYLSNGIVEAVIDDAGFAPDLLAAGVQAPLQNVLSPTGGTLVDLGLVGKGNDQLTQVFQVANLNPQNAFFYTQVSASAAPEVAKVTAQGFLIFPPLSTPSSPTLLVQTEYALLPGATALTITTTVINAGKAAAPVFNITDAVPLSARALLPFAPFPGRGFSHPVLELTPQGIGAALGLYPFVALPGNLAPGDGMIDTVSGASCGEVSYGILPGTLLFDIDGPAGPAKPNVTQLATLMGVNSALVSAVGNPFDPAHSPSIPPGGSLTYVRTILVGDRNDVASVSDEAFKRFASDPITFPVPPVSLVAGDVDADDAQDVEAAILVEGTLPALFGPATLPMTWIRTDKTGAFTAVLPVGEYTLTVVSPERKDVTGVRLSVAAGQEAFASIPKLSAVGRVHATVKEDGVPVTAKLTFLGVEGSPNPDFSRYFSGVTFDPASFKPVEDLQASTYGATPASNFLFAGPDGIVQTIRPGTYQVIASRGPERTIARKTVTVLAGKEVHVDLDLRRVVDTEGYVSADFHVHSARSFDASVPLEDRVRSYAAEGVEVLVSTDHNFITDLAPATKKLGLGDALKTVIGNELTTSLPTPTFPQGFGHHNVFPVKVDPLASRRGAPQTEYVPAAIFYDRMELNNPGVEKVVQLNHPRAGLAGLTIIGLFNTIGFDPTKEVPAPLLLASPFSGKSSLGFDAMEIFTSSSIGELQQARNDWFGLLNQGIVKTATAVSDSHRAIVEAAGFPRSYVAVPSDVPAEVTDQDLVEGVKSGNVLGTSGPYIRLSIDGHPIGSTIRKSRGAPITVRLEVDAPAWVPVDEVLLLENGRIIRAFNADTWLNVRKAPADPTSAEGVRRFAATFQVSPTRDAYYTAEAGIRLPQAYDTDGDGVVDLGDTNANGYLDSGDRGLIQPASPGIYAAIAPGFVPWAFTNPIFVDWDGKGYVAPGLDALRVPRGTVVSAGASTPPPVTSHGDYYPWMKLCIGEAEIAAFQSRLPEPARRVVAPTPDR